MNSRLNVFCLAMKIILHVSVWIGRTLTTLTQVIHAPNGILTMSAPQQIA